MDENSEFERRERARRDKKVEHYNQIAAERARLLSKNRYYAEQIERLIGSLVLPGARVLEVGSGMGDLLASQRPKRGVGIDVSPAMVQLARERHQGEAGLSFTVADVERDPLPQGPFDVIILSDTLGLLEDIETALRRLRELLTPDGRIVVTYYNFMWEPVLRLAEALAQKTRWPEQNWLSMTDIGNLLYLSGFQVVRSGTDVLVPINVPFFSELGNRVGAKVPVVKETALVQYFVARSVEEQLPSELPGVSVVCPCKDEKGNILEAVLRTPVMGSATELIFVDGNSTDGTYEEIERIIREYQGPLQLRLISQGSGKGKGDAVRKGYDAASHEVLMILDSDLTVPPEDLPKFFHALVSGKGDFINGVRLVYPMEGEAMRFLNLLGNKFFSLALSWVLEQPIKDSLCGTKVLYQKDYRRIAAERGFFGDFDPFGDFDLLFGAARLNMKIIDLPVRYRARTYGDTKISRFRHGWLLLKMTAFGFKKLRMGL
ncbi:MAG: methyltransferase domain-containing protein [Myxococcales bacterium]|nr:methyltransferase domain-containing protein [Myxococcales bacterium]